MRVPPDPEQMITKINRRVLSFSFSVCLLVFAVVVETPAQRSDSQPQKIKIYFYHEPGEYIDLSPVTRVIRTASPARAAIQALLKGPTAAERKQGFDGLASAGDFKIGSLMIQKGTARINFVVAEDWRGFPGDIAPARFKKAVELTLKQFPTVKEVVVSLNGDVNFDS
jgi:spore germination protein GerM